MHNPAHVPINKAMPCRSSCSSMLAAAWCEAAWRMAHRVHAADRMQHQVAKDVSALHWPDERLCEHTHIMNSDKQRCMVMGRACG